MGNKEKVYELVCGYISEAEDYTVAGVEVQDEFLEADIDKVIQMCIFHDMGEAITGDIPAFSA